MTALLAQGFFIVLAVAVTVGAVAFTAWLGVILVTAAWALTGLGMRMCGWQAMSRRSEAARGRFLEVCSRVAPLPRMGRISPYEGGPG